MKSKELVKLQHRDAISKKFVAGWSVLIPPNRTLGVGRTPAAAWAAAAVALVSKSRSTVRATVDKMIDFQERANNARDARQTIHVQATANTIRKFARKRLGVFRYRGRVIVPLRRTRTRAEIIAGHGDSFTV